MSPTSTAPDLLTSLKTGWNDAMQQWWDQSQAAFEPWRQAWETTLPGIPGRTAGMASHHHTHDCGSRCHCCVPDVDVLLHARAGERRVVPFLLRNPWRREREVSLAVGRWQMSDGGRLEVQSSLDAGESLTLQPCEERVVRLIVSVRAICDEGKEPKKAPDTRQDQSRGQSGCDVEHCVSAYADVRFEGCARPQRVGLVVHPASCDAVELPCECGCGKDDR